MSKKCNRNIQIKVQRVESREPVYALALLRLLLWLTKLDWAFSVMARCFSNCAREAWKGTRWLVGQVCPSNTQPIASPMFMTYSWDAVWPITRQQCPIFMNGWISFTFFFQSSLPDVFVKGPAAVETYWELNLQNNTSVILGFCSIKRQIGS